MYATLGAIDAGQSKAFYDAVLHTIGWSSHAQVPGWRGYSESGTGQGFVLWICQPFDGEIAEPGNGTMMGFSARSRDEVDAFHAAAIENGGTSEGTPGLRPQYSPTWYAAYVRDPSGNKIAAVFNPEP